ncbi:MAG TPA: AmmeMemoRadiSam system protein A [Deltaproteobacteria bacterium]|nr:AmmeMemoRadiSam system protein A [Deltaproteobacteria bacterium]
MHKGKEKEKVGVDLGLSEKDKKVLHHIARTVIEKACKGEKIPEFKVDSPILKEPRGAFVTLHKNGQLRGCIGHIRATSPLYKTVAEMAYAAAFEDPRFPPLRADELPYIDIEISVLTPFRKINDINEIKIGKHGLMIRKNGYSGLLLPQVPVEWKWDLNEFLEHTCLKAGLPKDAWKDKDTEIYVFSAEVF